MALKDFKINLLSKQLSDYDLAQKWADIPRLLEEYCITEGFHSLNEVPQGSEPIDNKSLDEEFVWIPFAEGNARIMVMLPHCDADSIIIPGLSRLIMTYTKGLDSVLSGVVDAVDNSLSTFGNAIKGTATAASQVVGQEVGKIAGEGAKNIIEGVGNKVKKTVSDALSSLGGDFGEIIGIARPIGMDDKYEYYMFDFGADIVPVGAILHYDSKKVRIMEPTKRLGNGIKERFIAEGGMGYIIGQGGGAGGAAGAGGFGGGGFGFGGGKGGNPISAPAGFLWKPISDSTGKLAVLVPERTRSSCVVNGESGSWGGFGNGSRAHYRFSKPGGAYGDNVSCVTSLGTFIIPHGALRYEGNGGGPVESPEDNGEDGGGEDAE